MFNENLKKRFTNTYKLSNHELILSYEYMMIGTNSIKHYHKMRIFTFT